MIYEANAFEGLRNGRLQLWWKVASICVIFIVSLVNSQQPWAIRLRVTVTTALKENVFMIVLFVSYTAKNDTVVLSDHGLLKHVLYG